MRRLTSEEISAAPKSCKWYTMENDDVIYLPESMVKALKKSSKIPISRIDIKSYQFSDADISISNRFESAVVFHNPGSPKFTLTNMDIFQLAKSQGIIN